MMEGKEKEKKRGTEGERGIVDGEGKGREGKVGIIKGEGNGERERRKVSETEGSLGKKGMGRGREIREER